MSKLLTLLHLRSLINGHQRGPNSETVRHKDERKAEEGDPGRDAEYGNKDALGTEKKGGCGLFLGPHNIRWRGPHSSPPPDSIPSFPTFLLGTCNRHSGRLCVPRIPIREKQLDTGRLTFFFHLLSAEQTQEKDWVSDRTGTLQRTQQPELTINR